MMRRLPVCKTEIQYFIFSPSLFIQPTFGIAVTVKWMRTLRNISVALIQIANKQNDPLQNSGIAKSQDNLNAFLYFRNKSTWHRENDDD